MTIASSESYLDVTYSFSGNVMEYSEGRMEKLGMSWRLKLEMQTGNIGVINKSFSPYVLPLLPTPLSGKNIQKKTRMISLKNI